MPAVRSLRSLGEPAKSTLREVVGKLLARDRATLDGVRALPSAAEMRTLSEQLADERKAARVNIDKLAHNETIKIAHQHYDSLKATWEKLRGAFGQADAITVALSRRSQLLESWRVLMPADKQYSGDSEAKLVARVENSLGYSLERVTHIPELGGDAAPDEPVLRDLYFNRVCRSIEAYNGIGEKVHDRPRARKRP